MFIDETWVKTNMAPLRGWGPEGQRLKAYAPYGHWKTLTFIAALRHDRIDAPWVIDGPINGELFRRYIERVLAPTLSPGDVVVLSKSGLQVNGKLLGNTAPRSQDSNARPLPHYPFGTYRVGSGTVWVASSYHPLSFDSRYFGPISTSIIRHRLKPFLTL